MKTKEQVVKSVFKKIGKLEPRQDRSFRAYVEAAYDQVRLDANV